jgi:glycosyltransferase involved in cell wall biosynthesis
MRIGFDLSPAAGFGSPGVAAAALGLWNALQRRGRHEWVPLRPAPGSGSRRFRQWDLPRLARQQGLAGLHLTVSALPLATGLPRVQTVHELPWRHGVAEGSDRSHRAWLRLGARLAAGCLVPSKQTAQDRQAELGPNRSAPEVVPWGGAEEITAEEPKEARQRVERRLNIRGPYWLMLGGTRPKKRLLELIETLGQSGQPKGRCLLVSGPSNTTLTAAQERARCLGLDLVHLDQRLGGPWPRAELSTLLSGAEALLCLAHSEGFGLPVLEALSAGTPAIVSPGSGPAQTFGARVLVAALERRPEESGSLAQALALARNQGSAEREANRNSVRHFTWERTAAAVEALWERLL